MAALSRLSPTHIGTAFESHSLRFLNHRMQMSLRRIGGAGDNGIDLTGWWYVPAGATRVETGPVETTGHRRGSGYGLGKWKGKSARPQETDKGMGEESPRDWTAGFGDLDAAGVWGEGYRRVRVVAQCKAERGKLSGRPVRELEGVMGHFHGRQAVRGPHQFSSSGRPLDLPPPDSVAVLLSQSGFSQLAMIRAWRSPSPIMLVHLPGGRPGQSPLEGGTAVDGADGADGEMRVEGAWWNPALAGPRGLFGGHLELRREILDSSGRDSETGEAEVRTRYRVWHKGAPISRLGPALEEDVH